MLDRVGVDEAVRELRPDFAVLVLTAEGLANGPSDHVSEGWLAEAAKAAGAAEKADAHEPHVEAWHDAYRAFGAKPKRTRPSVDALLRRGAALPSINKVVDAYNAVSVEYALPIGGEDFDAYQGAARLVRATGDEPFDVIADGAPAVDHPDPG
ncbi:MAG: B3/B4 domain-containing protein, partial [Spirillospora sp.]